MATDLQQRIQLLTQLATYMKSDDEEWLAAKEKASYRNGWFIPEFVDLATLQIARSFLGEQTLTNWAAQYHLPASNASPKRVGIVMAGNIPLVGFQDLLAVFISGHIAVIKTSSKDDVLLPHLIDKIISWNPEAAEHISVSERLVGCDAYIATGSNNTAGYFDYYFGKYPNIIRRNRSSAAILTGNETPEELSALADDVFLYFGLGCRNVTKIHVPEKYDFLSLIRAFRRYDHLALHHKFKNNYDYNLALHILNNKYYMSTEALLLVEDTSLFSPISQLHYEFYTDREATAGALLGRDDLQCLVGSQYTPFGQAQSPSITDYPDGVDTLRFLIEL